MALASPTRRVVWLTDPHFNFLDADQITSFLKQVAATNADAVLIGGDIGEAPSVIDYLRQIGAELTTPVYLVLGNHDFYFGSIHEVRRQVAELCRQVPRLHWLGDGQIVELAPETGLVGHDGWADARLGDYAQSNVMMNDYRLIAELAGHTKESRLPLLKSLGDEAAEYFRHTLPLALERYPHVIALIHVPPFREACCYEGRISDDEWLPHFTCKAAGDAILDVMRDFPGNRLTVLCGHTHSRGEARPAANIVVHTGGACYGEPEIQRVFEFE